MRREKRLVIRIGVDEGYILIESFFLLINFRFFVQLCIKRVCVCEHLYINKIVAYAFVYLIIYLIKWISMCYFLFFFIACAVQRWRSTLFVATGSP